MARTRFNLDLRTLDRLLILVHGNYAVGKTHLQGDFLLEEAQHGSVVFINTKGEDGYLSIANLGLGEIGETIETYQDFLDLHADYRKKGLRAFALDSIVGLDDIVLTKLFGKLRRPENPDEWNRFHMEANNIHTMLRELAPFGLAVASSDVSVDAVARAEAGNPTGFQGRVTPNLPGAQASSIAAKFDLVGHLTAEMVSPKVIKRKVTFAPSRRLLTRQRLPALILEDITIPDGRGGWLAIKSAIEQVLQPAAKEAATQ